jgi:Fe-Mn family superoxide dismutase
LSPDRVKLDGTLRREIHHDFESLDKFYEEFKSKALAAFGSGWVWLIEENGRLRIEASHDADNWIKVDRKAILVCDLWEHAYYIDYRNDRGKFIDSFFQLINWEFAQKNLESVWKSAS